MQLWFRFVNKLSSTDNPANGLVDADSYRSILVLDRIRESEISQMVTYSWVAQA